MNWLWYAIIIIIVEETLDLYLSYRQLWRYRHDKRVPEELKDVIKHEDFVASCSYQGERMSFRIVQSLVELPLTVLLLALKFYPYLWDHIGTEMGETLKSLAFCGVLLLMEAVLSVPWELYADFVIEEKHGFNRKTLKLFISDSLKGLVLAVVLGAPITVVVIKMVRWMGPNSYIYLWMVGMAFMLLMIHIAPILIMPWFNKYEPLKDQELKGKVEALAASLNYPLTNLYEMDGSKRTTHSNAFMFGLWRNKRIVLYDTLLKMDHEEIVAVLAHELGHWKKKHTLQMILVTAAQMFLFLYLFQVVVLSPKPYEDFGFSTNAVVPGMLIFARIVSPLAQVLHWAKTIYSRVNEFQADRFAKDLGHGGMLRSALIKLGVESKSTFNPDKW
eukprot:Protomagalhaensia_sp_Gyna_25__5706@NODE_815_length_2560_cov_293_264578_g642_i0_p1_GENE_NODE_815_length_2560_cov_293_264578_g642_i0NODE_815_length_2560_cov_293_264578_g642_i0_p1_ORF_typecomplete_len388_score82_49Peptidase_M48_N/PF16491_5/1_5e53Peptidase_M48_N/PF16491_5/4_6e02Peptidase_M48/PF01435_18/5_4e03Peptidase_M48/PF01435_18/2_4e36Peptidase_M56/PF05569_11/2_8e02Peptidase_M56/PF05569_11/3_7e15Peptidase_M56/PF05569_11/3_9e02Peptidase_M78/PF06114_13/0_011HXXEE/PF13787_6/4_5e03HXXEE/PF13787_6/0_